MHFHMSNTGAKLVKLKETLAAEMARKRAELRKERSQMYDLENEEGFDMDDEAELTGKKCRTCPNEYRICGYPLSSCTCTSFWSFVLKLKTLLNQRAKAHDYKIKSTDFGGFHS